MPNNTVGFLSFTNEEQDKLIAHVAQLQHNADKTSKFPVADFINMLADLNVRKYNFYLNPELFDQITLNLNSTLRIIFAQLSNEQKIETLAYLSDLHWPLSLMPYMSPFFMKETLNKNFRSWNNRAYVIAFIEANILYARSANILRSDVVNEIMLQIDKLLNIMFHDKINTNLPRLLECLDTLKHHDFTNVMLTKLLTMTVIFLKDDTNPSNFFRIMTYLTRMGIKFNDFSVQDQAYITSLFYQYGYALRNELGPHLCNLGQMGFRVSTADQVKFKSIFNKVDFSSYNEQQWVIALLGIQTVFAPLHDLPVSFRNQVLELIKTKFQTFSSQNIAFILEIAAKCGIRSASLDLNSQRNIILKVSRICTINNFFDVAFFVRAVPALIEMEISESTLLAVIPSNTIISVIDILCAQIPTARSLWLLSKMLDICDKLKLDLRFYAPILAHIRTHIACYDAPPLHNLNPNFVMPLLISLNNLGIADPILVEKTLRIAHCDFTMEDRLQLHKVRFCADSKQHRSNWSQQGLRYVNGIIHRLRAHIAELVTAQINIPGTLLFAPHGGDIFFPKYQVSVCIERGSNKFTNVHLPRGGIIVNAKFNYAGINETVQQISAMVREAIQKITLINEDIEQSLSVAKQPSPQLTESIPTQATPATEQDIEQLNFASVLARGRCASEPIIFSKIEPGNEPQNITLRQRSVSDVGYSTKKYDRPNLA